MHVVYSCGHPCTITHKHTCSPVHTHPPLAPLHFCTPTGTFPPLCLGTCTLVVVFPEPGLPGLPGTTEGAGPHAGDTKEARLQEKGVVEAKPCLPRFITRAVMNPLGRSSPRALHSRSLPVQRDAFDTHRQLSDGTKSLLTPLFLLPLFLPPPALTSPPPACTPTTAIPFLLYEKYSSQRGPPTPRLDSLTE